MEKGRVEAFSDGVVAIIITIMVLEMKVPEGTNLQDLKPVLPVFLSYVLSFIYVGIYWNNHHHMFQAVEHVNGKVLWANTHLLFWLSLVPFASAWMGENHFQTIPTALYGFILLMCGWAYFILAQQLVKIPQNGNILLKAMRGGTKEKISIAANVAAICMAFLSPYIALFLFAGVAVMWFIPDKRIEKQIHKEE